MADQGLRLKAGGGLRFKVEGRWRIRHLASERQICNQADTFSSVLHNVTYNVCYIMLHNVTYNVTYNVR